MMKYFKTAVALVALGGPALAQEDFLSRYEAMTRGPEPVMQGPSPSDGLATQSAMTPEKIDGFNRAIEQIFPMTPEMIRRYREIYQETQDATLETPEPEARSSTELVSLEPGEAPPVITVAPGIASVMGFYDASGAPWPINQYVIGNGQDFEVIRLGENANNLTISPSRAVGHTNIVALLEGMDKPVTVRVRISRGTAHFRHDIQVMELGPEAAPNTAMQPRVTTVEEAGNSVLLAALSSVDLPRSAVPVSVSGVDARGWIVGEDLYIRSRHALLSPSWAGSMSGPDGVRVYKVGPVSYALFSVDGQIVRAGIELP